MHNFAQTITPLEENLEVSKSRSASKSGVVLSTMHYPRAENSISLISNQRVRAFQKRKEMESIYFDGDSEDLN